MTEQHEQILQLLITGGFLDPGKLREARDIIGKCAPSGSLEEAARGYADLHYKPINHSGIITAQESAKEMTMRHFLAGASHSFNKEVGMIWEVLQLSEGEAIGLGVRIATTITGALSQHICDWLNVEPQKPKEIYYIPRLIDPSIPPAHSFNKESFLTALRDSNPYPEPDSNDKAWNECFKKVIELLNQKEK